MTQAIACPLCGLGVDAHFDPDRRTWGIPCSRCGKYRITDAVEEILNDDVRPLLSAATRLYGGQERWGLLLTTKNFETEAARFRHIEVSSRREMLLRELATRCAVPGGSCELDTGIDYPLIAARNPAELSLYLSDLADRKLITIEASRGSKSQCRVQLDGWQSLEPTKQIGGEPGTCFIAMWFDPSVNDALVDGIEPAVSDCGFTPVRIDKKEHNNQITDEIMAGIRGAEFMVADFTGQRGGVYYEAGFARGLGRDVIYCCREDEMAKVHFDTRTISHVTWRDPAHLRKKLADRIKATILPKA
jgi:hypothetical protein